MENQLDFEGLAREILLKSRDVLPVWLPGGKLVGREYTCGNLRGEPGNSLKVNVDTGRWADFAGTEKGGDLISLYAAIEGIGQGEAARRLAEDTGYELRETKPYDAQSKPEPEPEIQEVKLPPFEAEPPVMSHSTLGEPSKSWVYKDRYSNPMFYIARYDSNGGKQIIPYSWSVNGGWVMKGWKSPRPLYGLDLLEANPKLPVMIVEGEKAADAAREICSGKYVVVTWPNGAKAVKNADWSAIYGRNVIIWPDNDEPGISAAETIAGLLEGKCQQVKIIYPSDVPESFDAADALAEGWTWDVTRSWATARARTKFQVEPAIATKAEPVEAQTFSVQKEESRYAVWDKCGIASTKSGQPICNADNVLRVFEYMPKMQGIVWYDEFQKKYFTKSESGQAREWRDIDDLNVMSMLQRDLGLSRISDDIVRKAVMVYAHRNIKNEPRDWFDTLVWDKTPRLDMFLHAYLGADYSEYSRCASKNWWISMVARVYQPGCKADNMVILEGGQGKLKSTALGAIGGRWFSECHESANSPNFYHVIQGKLIVEIAELDAFSRAEVNTIKKVISCQVDRYRPPYSRAAEDFPRQCIFVGTTNEEDYLKDNTGARRFWPIRIGQVNISLIRDDRDQLFAEAVHRYKAGETWWEMPTEETLREQEGRRQADEWERIIGDYLINKQDTTITEVAVEALKIDVGKIDVGLQRRIGKTMKILGWSKHNLMRGGRQMKIWRSPSFYDTEGESDF